MRHLVDVEDLLQVVERHLGRAARLSAGQNAVGELEFLRLKKKQKQIEMTSAVLFITNYNIGLWESKEKSK